MANRIVKIADLSVEELSTLESEDIEFKSLSRELNEQLAAYASERFHISCPDCDHGSDVPQEYLGRRVRCPKCENQFIADWGELAE